MINHSRRTPFTLIELLAVIAIIIVLAGITVGGLNYASKKADQTKTIAAMTEFELALDTFKNDYGYYPVFDGEVDLSKDEWKLFMNATTNKRKSPYIEGYSTSDKIIDAYGNALRYKNPPASGHNSTKYDLWSAGPDGDSSTDDDNICNWKQN